MSFIRCTRCLMPTTRPSTHFVDGVCSACLNYAKRQQIDWKAREDEFQRILNDVRRKNNSQFDVIVASSGGKDSTAQVLKMLELGIRPLVVTATTCHLTDIGRKNIDNLQRIAGNNTIEYSPNIKVRRKLNRLSLQLVGDISLPEHMAIFSTPFQAALEHRIPVIIYGEAPLMEYGGPPGSEQAKTMTRRWVMEHGGFLGMRPSDFVGMEGITEADMSAYCLPPAHEMEALGVTAYFLGQYYPWDSRANALLAKQHGFVAKRPSLGNWWDFENLDNAQTGIHDHFTYLKYGFGRACAQLSIDVRHGVLNREEAFETLNIIDGRFPYEYMNVKYETILENIGMSQKEFWEICYKFTDQSLLSEEKQPRERNG